MRHALIIALFAGTLTAQVVDPCGDCPEGEVPGAGTITVTFISRSYIEHPGCDAPQLCTKWELTGSIDTNAVRTYSNTVVYVTGTRIIYDNDCCNFLNAPTVTQLEGTVEAIFNDGFETAVAYVDWQHLGDPENTGFQDFGPGPATCTRYNDDAHDGPQGLTGTFSSITVSFSGGHCEPEGGGGGGGGGGGQPPEPPEPPQPPGPDDPPPHEEPPDPPQPPVTEDDPDDPEPPEPPEPPQPPIDDMCCIAITTRLDNLLLFAEDTAQLHRNSNIHLENINTWLEALYGALVSPDHGVWGIIPDIQRTLYDMRAYMGQIQALMIQDAEYQHDQTWYLAQIYAGTQSGGGGTPNQGDDIILGTSSSSIAQLPIGHLQNQHEQNQTFHLPDLEQYDDNGDPLIVIPLAFARNIGIPIDDITVNLEPYDPVRNIVRTVITLLATLNGIFIVWREFRKT